MHLYTIFDVFLLLLYIPFLFIILFKKSGIDKSTEWSMIPACPSLMYFFNKGNAEGTNALNFFCLMFVYVVCTFVSGLILLFLVSDKNFLKG